MSPAVQARMEAALGGPVRIEPAQRPTVDPRAPWDRMDAHGLSQNGTARRAGISGSLLSQITNGQRTTSGEVLRKLHGVQFQPSASELVVPAEVKVMAWKKDERQGVVIKGAGGPGAGGNNPGGGTVRIGGRVPWGAEVEYAYRAGYDSRGQVSVTHLVDERGYGVMLAKPEAGSAWKCAAGTPDPVSKGRPYSHRMRPPLFPMCAGFSRCPTTPPDPFMGASWSRARTVRTIGQASMA